MIEKLKKIKQEVEATAIETKQLPNSIYELLKQAAQQFSSQNAIRYFFEAKNFQQEASGTFQQLLEGVTQSANLIHGLGVQKDEAVAVILPRIPEAYLATLGAGIVANVHPIEASLPSDQIAALLQEANPKVLICSAPFPAMEIWDLLETIRPHLSNLKIILQVDMADYLGKLKRMGVRMSMRNQGKADKVPGQQLGDFNRSRKKMPDNKLNFDPNAKSDFGVFHSSGATMEPFSESISQKSFIQSAWGTAQYIKDQNLFLDLSPSLLGGITAGILASCFSGKPTITGAFLGESFAGLIGQSPKLINHFELDGAISTKTEQTNLNIFTPQFIGETGEIFGFSVNKSELIPLPFKNLEEHIDPLAQFNIPFSTIQQVIESHDSVKNALIIPQPDISGKWIPVAYIQINHNAQPDLRGIYNYAVANLDERITPPQGLRIIDQLPLTPMKTTRIYSLIRQEIENAVRRELEDLGINDDEMNFFSNYSHEKSWQGKIELPNLLSDSYTQISNHFKPFPITISVEDES